MAEALQRRLLPAERPDGPGLEIASRYLPAAGASLGGDWYDVFPVPDGRIALAVGDVVGHGIEAAAVMGQLRTALRAYAVEGHPPAAVVDRVNHLMANLGPNAMTTLAYLVLDPAEESLELVNAGHPPPLVIDPSGAAAFLKPSSGIPLGATAAVLHRADTFPLATGAIVLLYTDGLVEPQAESIDVGLERLRALAEGCDDVDRLCATIVERMVPESPADDVAFIAARVPPLADHVRTRWPATSESLADARYLLRRWLRSRGAAEDETYDIVVASQEACANAIEHAYGPGASEYELEARLEGRRVRITVRDRGALAGAAGRGPRARPPDDAGPHGRGRGPPVRRRHRGRPHAHAGAGVVNLLAQIVEERTGELVTADVRGEIDASNAAWIGAKPPRDAHQPQ